MVVVLPTLPIKGVSFLLENDLAGGKVVVNPMVVSDPIISSAMETFEEASSACDVTRAMTKDKQRDYKPGIHLASDEALLDLSDTILNPEEGVAVDDPLVKRENQNEISRIIKDVPLQEYVDCGTGS